MDIKEKVLNNRKNGMAMMLLFIIFYAAAAGIMLVSADYRVDSAYATGDHLDFHRLDPVSGT